MGKSAPSAFNGALLSCDLNRETHRITRLLAKLNGTRHGTAAGIPSTRRPRPGVKSGKRAPRRSLRNNAWRLPASPFRYDGTNPGLKARSSSLPKRWNETVDHHRYLLTVFPTPLVQPFYARLLTKRPFRRQEFLRRPWRATRGCKPETGTHPTAAVDGIGNIRVLDGCPYLVGL